MNNQKVMGSNYPRVTEIIRATESPEKQKNLLKWIKKMEAVHGVDGAEIERQKILNNGTGLHLSIERFLGHIVEENPHHKLETIKPLLKLILKAERLLIENRLFCHKHKFQGAPDLVCCDFDGVPTIFDWTTSKGVKKKQWIEHKFVQCGAYAIACELELGIKIEQLAVVVVVNSPDKFQLFTELPDHWKTEFLQRLKTFSNMMNTAN